MNKINYLFALLAVLLGINVGRAQTSETVNNYSVDFNTSISTSAHDFKVASGWGHVVDYLQAEDWDSEDTYVSYSYSSIGGVDGSGALSIGTQSLSSGSDGSGTNVRDLLVTPKISGKSSIYVKKRTNSGSISFYTVTKSGTTYTRGTQISVTIPDLSTDNFVKVDIPEQTGTYIGIRGSSVYIDNFTAESATIDKNRALKINTVKLFSDDEPDCDAEGNFSVRLGVILQNSGDVDLKTGDENYSISLQFKESSSSEGTTVATAKVPFDLAAGATATDTAYVEAKLPYATYKGRNRYDVKENITSTQAYGGWVEPTAYAPSLKVGDSNTSNIANGTAVAFGMISEATSKSYSIKNDGAAPLNVTSITVPEGFFVDKSKFTVAAHGTDNLTVTALAEKPGIYSGNLTLKADGIDDYTLALSATVLDPAKYYVTFEDGKDPVGMILGNDWKVKKLDVYDRSTNKYVAEKTSDNSLSKLILPLLKVEANEKFSFDAGRTSTSSNDSKLNVYYSTDRTNWILAREIKTEELSKERVPDASRAYESKPINFVIDNVPAGNYYIAFEAGYAYVDNIYGYELVPVDHDLLITKSEVPSTATVNNAYTATATLKNNNSKAEANYTAELYVDGKQVASAEPTEIAAGETKDFTFTYTPHTAGTFEANILFKAGDVNVSSDTVNLVITRESANTDVQIGEAKSTSTSAPLNLSYYNSQSETVYPKDLLSGLKQGDKLTSITYKGYKTDETPINSTVTIYLQNTSDAPVTESTSDDDDYGYGSSSDVNFTATDESKMTKVYSGTYTFTKNGTNNDHQPILSVTFNEPFVYDGNNLRVVVKSENADTWKSVTFESTANEYTWTKRNDNHDSFLTASYSNQNTPVVHFGVEGTPNTISGTITSNDAAVTNATVTLTSGDVVYSGNTDADGKYSIPVIQTDKDYSLSVVADGYEGYTENNISFTSGNVTRDIQLTAADITVTITDAGWASFSSTKSVAVPDGLTAYIVTSENGMIAKLAPVDAIPANTGVLLKGAAGEYTLAVDNNAVAVTGNLLGNTAEASLTIGNSEYGKVYAFGIINGETGFVKASKSYTIERGKAYLNVSSTTNAKNFISFDDVVDAIRNINTTSVNVLDDSKPMYNLQGMRVSKSFKGVVIQNGKKFIKK